MVVLHCNGRIYGNTYLIALHARTHACSIDPAIVGSTSGRLLSEFSGV
jgi:hypothetical protein